MLTFLKVGPTAVGSCARQRGHLRVDPLEMVKLPPVMELTRGRQGIVIGLIDGPVAKDHPDLAGVNVRELRYESGSVCRQPYSAACRHATFLAGMLSGLRQSPAPSLCPDCTLLVRPIFAADPDEPEGIPSAQPEQLAAAIADCIAAGACVLNLSVSLSDSSSTGEKAVEEVLNHAVQNGVLIVAAAGNQGTICSSAITRHQWVIPVAACDRTGKPMNMSNLGPSVGRHGLMAPGDRITSIDPSGTTLTLSGTSFAAPFVTGNIALLWSIFSDASGAEVKTALVARAARHAAIVPPMLDAFRACKPRRIAKSSKNSKVVTPPRDPASKAAFHPRARPW